MLIHKIHNYSYNHFSDIDLTQSMNHVFLNHDLQKTNVIYDIAEISKCFPHLHHDLSIVSFFI